MPLRPLSQTGFHRIPRTPRGRNIDPSTGEPTKRSRLAGWNERLVKDGLVLHPTKGFRPVSEKRATAGLLTEELKRGLVPFNTAAMKKRMARGF
ncbi:hypothetical protein V5F79_22290 [Xanthobacter flavus]|uniref:hypothetical protein n=1 Tax=Xanthobacter flavus TaxID=281 RepID=UPI0037276542